MKVLVIIARGLHLGYIGCYGNDWVETPTLDRIAAEGIVCDQHFCANLDLGPNRLAWETGRRQISAASGGSQGNLVASLRQCGIKTFLLGSAPLPAGDTRWDHLTWPKTGKGRHSTRAGAPHEMWSLLPDLAAAGDWLLQIELDTLVPPQIAPALDTPSGEGDPERPELAAQDCYAAAVAALDRQLGQIRADLEAAGILDDLCWMITSDRGQPIDEARPATPEPPWLHEEWIHLPLIIRLPQRAQAMRRIEALTQSIDILPTIFDLQSVECPGVEGQSLRALLEGRDQGIRTHALAMAARGETRSWAMRTKTSSILIRQGTESFDPFQNARVFMKPEDRWEVNNVCQHHLELVEETRQFILEAMRET
jgi:arylsulfatase A-like enzyme